MKFIVLLSRIGGFTVRNVFPNICSSGKGNRMTYFPQVKVKMGAVHCEEYWGIPAVIGQRGNKLHQHEKIRKYSYKELQGFEKKMKRMF